MRVLMIAPPGAGKGTQGALIAAHFDIPHIATGELLRDHVARRTPLGLAVQEYLDCGELVPDQVVLDMVRAELIAAKAAGGGYVLDGIPRNMQQARAAYLIARELGMTADVALHLQAGDAELMRRLLARAALEHRSVGAGFYRTCVLDGIPEHSPAEHVRRPAVPAESPTPGFTHRQFGALLTAGRESPNPCDFALVAMLGQLGLRIFEAAGADIEDPGEERGTGCCACAARAPKAVLVPLPPAVGRATDRATGSRTRGPVLLNSRGARMDRHAATGHLHQLAEAAGIQVTRAHPHMLRHTVATRLDAGVDLRDVQIAARHADPRTTMRYDSARQNLDRHPNYILAASMASGTWSSLRLPDSSSGRRPALPR